jgi:hypothetical protein
MSLDFPVHVLQPDELCNMIRDMGVKAARIVRDEV